jgi:hypothetical protein
LESLQAALKHQGYQPAGDARAAAGKSLAMAAQ